MLTLIALLFGKNAPKGGFSERLYLVANVVLDALCAACWTAVKAKEGGLSFPLMAATTMTTFGASFVWWRLLTWRRSSRLLVVKVMKIAAFGSVWTIGAVTALQFWDRLEPVGRGISIGVGVVTLVSFALYLRRGGKPPSRKETQPASCATGR